MADVIDFKGQTRHDIDAAKMLKNIAEEKPDHAIVICIKDGNATFHSSTADAFKITYYLEAFKSKIINGRF